jgi:hypothetical protein
MCSGCPFVSKSCEGMEGEIKYWRNGIMDTISVEGRRMWVVLNGVESSNLEQAIMKTSSPIDPPGISSVPPPFVQSLVPQENVPSFFFSGSPPLIYDQPPLVDFPSLDISPTLAPISPPVVVSPLETNSLVPLSHDSPLPPSSFVPLPFVLTYPFPSVTLSSPLVEGNFFFNPS